MPKINKTKLYARALAEIAFKKITQAEEKKIVDNFLKLLTTTGQEKKAKEILNLAEDFLLAKQGKRKIIFESARKITPGQKKLLQGVSKEGDVIKEKINPELIAGVKILINNEKQFDASMLKKINNLF